MLFRSYRNTRLSTDDKLFEDIDSEEMIDFDEEVDEEGGFIINEASERLGMSEEEEMEELITQE